jgi:hypothetical protein
VEELSKFVEEAQHQQQTHIDQIEQMLQRVKQLSREELESLNNE